MTDFNTASATAAIAQSLQWPVIGNLENTLRVIAYMQAFRNYVQAVHVPREGDKLLTYIDMLYHLLHIRTFPNGVTFAEQRTALLDLQDKYLTCPTYYILHSLGGKTVAALNDAITLIRFCGHENPRIVDTQPMCILLDRTLSGKHEAWKKHVEWVIECAERTQQRTSQ